VTRRPSSLLGVPRDRFPRLIGVWGALTSCRPSRLASVVPRLRGTTLCPLVRSDGCGALLPSAPEVYSRRPPLAVPAWKTTGPPRFLGCPYGNVPCSRQTPVGPTLPCHLPSGVDSVLRVPTNPGPHDILYFGAQSHGPTPLLSTLHGRPCDPDLVQDSLLARWLRFDQAGLPPRWGTPYSTFKVASVPPFPAEPGFSWRT